MHIITAQGTGALLVQLVNKIEAIEAELTGATPSKRALICDHHSV